MEAASVVVVLVFAVADAMPLSVTSTRLALIIPVTAAVAVGAVGAGGGGFKTGLGGDAIPEPPDLGPLDMNDPLDRGVTPAAVDDGPTAGECNKFVSDVFVAPEECRGGRGAYAD